MPDPTALHRTALPPPLPLSPDQAGRLTELTAGLDSAGLWWMSGYAAGLAQAQAHQVPTSRPAVVAARDVQPAPQLTIIYGSQTGNAKRLAEQLAQQLDAAGLGLRLLRADDYPLRELKNERYLAIVISTQGDGDPPDDARALVEFITGQRAPKLAQLHYAVLGLGDSSYPRFCVIGRQLDERLAELGATRWIDRGDADLDIETVATPWLAQALVAARASLAPQPASEPPAPLASVTALRPDPPATRGHTRDHPFAAGLLVNQRITGRGSDRDVRHIELSLEGSGLTYEPGDALGVWPVNPPALVDAVLAALALDGAAIVAHAGHSLPLRQWLEDRRELTRLSRPFIARHAATARSEVLDRLLAPEQADAFAKLLATRQVIDLLQAHPGSWSADEFVAALRPLTPRLYSIASSQQTVGDEAHLTVAHVEYELDGDTRWGAASNLLARTSQGGTLPVFIEPNTRFRLPQDATRDVVMIGPGTGIAPFRGFVQQRAAAGATGRNWLLFGNPHARSDFLYQLEWQDALKRGQLQRLDLAFSRDQAHKVYVQHRLREHGRELHAWLEGGAHVYVCGDASRMARDVHAALLAVVAEHGNRGLDEAEDHLRSLQTQGRYVRDVY